MNDIVGFQIFNIVVDGNELLVLLDKIATSIVHLCLYLYKLCRLPASLSTHIFVSSD